MLGQPRDAGTKNRSKFILDWLLQAPKRATYPAPSPFKSVNNHRDGALRNRHPRNCPKPPSSVVVVTYSPSCFHRITNSHSDRHGTYGDPRNWHGFRNLILLLLCLKSTHSHRDRGDHLSSLNPAQSQNPLQTLLHSFNLP